MPYYSLHKVVAGLVDAAEKLPADQGGDEAKEVAHNLALYLSHRLVGKADTKFDQPLDNLSQQIEYGSMNDSLYRIYAMTKDDAVKKVADIFNDDGLFQLFVDNPNQGMDGWHANTTIPKFFGALTKYEIFTQNKDLYDKLTPAEQAQLPMYKQAAENLWQNLISNHTFVNGGNSVAEHLHEQGKLWSDAVNWGVDVAYGNNSTDENCNIYNLLKLTRELFRIDRDAKYAKYYQWAFTNHIVAAQNPDTGMFAYFQPMDAGYFKVYDSPNLDPDGTGTANAAADDAHRDASNPNQTNVTRFWCDTGTGVESAAKYGDSFYFVDNTNGANDIYVNDFYSSTYVGANGLTLTQKSNMPKQDTTTITVSGAAEGTRVRLLVPDWAAGEPIVTVNGTVQKITNNNGYLDVPVSGNTTITYRIPMAVKSIATQDNADYVSFAYGPLLLATKLPVNTDQKLWTGGTNVQSANYDFNVTNTIVPQYNTSKWLNDIAKNLVRVDSPTDGGDLQSIRFKLASVSTLRNKDDASKTVAADSVTFQPWYTVHNSRYGIYFYMAHDNDAIEASSVEQPKNVRTQVGVAPILPKTAKVTWSDGSSSDEIVTWDPVDPASYTKPAWFDVHGSVQGLNVTVHVEVTDAKPTRTVKPSTVTTKAGTAPTLPSTVQVTWSDGQTTTENVVWDAVKADSYAKPGRFTVKGKALDLDASVDVTVQNAPKSVVAPDNLETNVGRVAKLPKTAKVIWADGSTTDETVDWQSVDSQRFFTIGAFSVAGKVQGLDVRVLISVTLKDGTYIIATALEDGSRVLDVPAASKKTGQPIQLYTANGTMAQRYKFKHLSNGNYTIRNVNSGLYLAHTGGQNGTRVTQERDRDDETTQWTLTGTDTALTIAATGTSNLVMDLQGANNANGAAIQIYTSNNTIAQQWRLSGAQTSRDRLDRLAGKHANDIADGLYTVVYGKNNSLALDVTAASHKNGANVQVYTGNKTDAQVWRISHDADGYATITNAISGKVLDVAAAGTKPGTNVQQYDSNSTYAQKWIVISEADGFKLQSGIAENLVLDVSAGSTKSGANVQIYSSNESAAQRWRLKPTTTLRSRLGKLAADHRGDLPDGTYVFRSAKRDSLVLDVSAGSHNNGANVQIYTNNGTAAQRWKVTHDGNGYITLRNVGSGKALDIAGASTGVGANVQQYASNSTYAQKWVAVRDGDSIKLLSALTDYLALDVAAGSTKSGANVQVYTDNGTPAQRWNAVK